MDYRHILVWIRPGISCPHPLHERRRHPNPRPGFRPAIGRCGYGLRDRTSGGALTRLYPGKGVRFTPTFGGRRNTPYAALLGLIGGNRSRPPALKDHLVGPARGGAAVGLVAHRPG